MKITRSQLTELIKDEMVHRLRQEGKVTRMTEAQLRLLVEEELSQASIGQPGAQGLRGAAAIKKLRDHLAGAKDAVSELYQASTSSKASDQAQTLLQGLNRMIGALDSMPELAASKSTPPPPPSQPAKTKKKGGWRDLFGGSGA